MALGDAAQAGLEIGGGALELLVGLGAREARQRREAGRHRERVARQRAGLVDRAERCEPLHQVAAPAERGGRHAAADDLAQHRQVRDDVVALLRTAARDAEARHDLVEHEQRAARVARVAQALEEPGRRRDATHVARDGLDDHARELVAVALDDVARPPRDR